MKYEIEITRHNVTPATFLSYVRSQLKKHGLDDVFEAPSLDYLAAGNDLNFDVEHDGMHERSISKPYETQTYIRWEDGTVYNLMCEFDFWDEKTGTGYFYAKDTGTEAHQEAREALQDCETLYLEKRGCDFFSGDPVAQLSDIGNYRVVTHGETIPGKDGRMYCFEFTHWERYNYRSTHKVTGKPLKHHVKELMNPNALCIDSQYTDNNGCWRNCALESELHSRNRDFTVAGILETVNEVSSTHYSRIVFAPEKAIKAIGRIRKQAGFRELSVLDNLESVEVKQADRQYLVFAYYDMNGNGFEYEYNSNRIVG